MTLAGADRRTVTVIAAPQVQLGALSIGDRVNALYCRSVAFLVSPSMRVPRDATDQLPPAQAELLGRPTRAQIAGQYSVLVTQISGLLVGIRPAAHTIDVVNPTGGQIFTIHASNPSRDALMQSLKLGDLVTAVVSPPIATAIEPERGLLGELRDLFNR